MIESKYLKADRQNIEKLMVIPSLKKFKTEHLCTILRQSKIRKYEHGEVIIQEGDTDPWLYFVLSGKVKILKQGEVIIVIERQGEVLGEMSLIDGSVRSSTIRSEGNTICLAVDSSASNTLVSKEEKIEYLLILYKIFMDAMSARLRLRTEEIAAIRKENSQLREEIEKIKKQLGK
jgi:CRP-like cAMP-binding protein